MQKSSSCLCDRACTHSSNSFADPQSPVILYLMYVCLRRSKTYVFFLAGQWGWGSVSVSESVCVFLYGVIMTMSETE